MNTNTELDKCPAQVEAPGSWWCMVSGCSQQHKQHASWREEQHRPRCSQITCTGLTLVLEELSNSQFLHLEAHCEAGVPLKMFKRKIRNFLNGADTKYRGTPCICDKIELRAKPCADTCSGQVWFVNVFVTRQESIAWNTLELEKTNSPSYPWIHFSAMSNWVVRGRKAHLHL